MKPFLLTADLPADVTGWWVSEKYDGVRAIWTGTKLLSRHGKDLHAPASFTAGLPKNIRLDGEIWMGRGTFDKLVSTIQRKGSDWAGVRYMVFDLAGPGTFESRCGTLNMLRFGFGGDKCIKVTGIKKCPHVEVIDHRGLRNHDDLDQTERDIVAQGGEGCVIRRRGHLYRPGRAGDVIKVKRLVADVDHDL